MKLNTTIQKVLKALGTIALIVLAALPLYNNRTKSTALEIKKINEIELTRPFEVDRLTSTYLYDSIPVEHLWQVSYVIKNTGDVTLLGEGFDNKNIRGNAIALHIYNCEKLLSIDVINTNTDAVLQEDHSLKFNQWRPNEYVELMLLSDGSVAPDVAISDRDIPNVSITKVMYSPEEQLVQEKMVDRWSKGLKSTLWWITIVVEVISFILLFLSCIMPIIQSKNAKERKENTSSIWICLWIAILVLLPMLWMF